MFDNICNLIPVTSTVNTAGDTILTDGQPKTVFCRVKSYSLKDKFMAGADGDVPEMTIVLSDKLDYSGEPYVEYNNTRYKVIHTAYDDLHNDIGLVVSKWQP